MSKKNQPPDPAGVSLRSLIRSARGSAGTPLAIQRHQGRLDVVLPPGAGPGHAPDATAPETQAMLMHLDLQAHLDRCADSRAVLPHLAALEQALERRGMRALADMPLPLLRRASGQLQGLAQEPVLEGFALLQARLDVAIVVREEIVADMRKPNALSSFFVDHKLQVSEVSMSAFMRVAGYPETVPLDLGDEAGRSG